MDLLFLAWKYHEPKRSRDFQAVEPLGKRFGVKMYLKTSKAGRWTRGRRVGNTFLDQRSTFFGLVLRLTCIAQKPWEEAHTLFPSYLSPFFLRSRLRLYSAKISRALWLVRFSRYH